MNWSFRYYIAADGDGEIRAAYDALGRKGRGVFLARLQALSSLPEIDWWRTGYAKQLTGLCAGLSEIRFKADQVQQRPLGFRSGETEFTIVFWATEKNGRFVPKSACVTALSIKAKIQQDRTKSHAIWLALE